MFFKRKPPSIRVGSTEIEKRGLSRYDLKDPYHLALTLSWPRFFLLFIVIEVGINIVFAMFYLALPGSVQNVRPGHFIDVFFFSIETWATVGYGTMSPGNIYGHTISSIEIFSGMISTAIVTGLMFVRFSRPKSKLMFPQYALIVNENGQKILSVRVGNGRMTTLGDANAALRMIMFDPKSEKREARSLYELKLDEASLPLLPISWTIRHTIDTESPLAGLDSEALADLAARLIVTVHCYDHAISTRIYDVGDYDADKILFGKRYVDLVSFDENRNASADMSKFNDLLDDSD